MGLVFLARGDAGAELLTVSPRAPFIDSCMMDKSTETSKIMRLMISGIPTYLLVSESPWPNAGEIVKVKVYRSPPIASESPWPEPRSLV